MSRFNEVLNFEPQLKLSLDVFKLIQPDLLTAEELVAVLQERGVASSLLPQSKDHLVSLFKRVAYPLPQREFRENHRGSLLMKQRQKTNRITFNESCTDRQSSFTIGVSGNPSISKNRDEVKLPAARLKPPPDFINFEKKTIKLNSSKSSTASQKHTSSSDLERIVIKRRKTSESSNESTTDKRVTFEIVKTSVGDTTEKNKQQKLDDGLENGSLKQECNGSATKPIPKKVSLKRNHLFSKAPSLSTEADASDKPASEPDKKRKPITWP